MFRRTLAACLRVPSDDDSGQTMVEYVAILSVITVAIILSIGALTGNISNMLDATTAAIDAVVG